MEGRVFGFRARLGGIEGQLLLRIENGKVGKRAADQGAAAAKIETASRSGGEEFDDARKRDALLAMHLGDRQRERSFKSGDAERRALEFHLLFVRGVRSVIGVDSVHRTVA